MQPNYERINSFLVKILDIMIYLPPSLRSYEQSIARDAYIYSEFYRKQYARRVRGQQTNNLQCNIKRA